MCVCVFKYAIFTIGYHSLFIFVALTRPTTPPPRNIHVTDVFPHFAVNDPEFIFTFQMLKFVYSSDFIYVFIHRRGSMETKFLNIFLFASG